MRTQLSMLKLAATVIVATVTVIAPAQGSRENLFGEPVVSKQGNQSKSKKKEEGGIGCSFGVSSIVTTIYASVTDSKNQPITDLTNRDFAVREDGVEQEISFFVQDDSSVSFRLAFYISDFEPLRLMARQIAWSFVRQIRSTDDVAIPQLNAGRKAVREFSADKRNLDHALGKVFSKNKSSLFDNISGGRDTREERRDHRGSMIVVTDMLSLSDSSIDREAAYAIFRNGFDDLSLHKFFH